MSEYILSMRRIMIAVRDPYDKNSLYLKDIFIPIDYGLIFSASSLTQRYIVTDERETVLLGPEDVIVPCNLK